MALYLDTDQRRELAHRPPVARPVQAVKHAIDARGVEFGLNRRGPFAVLGGWLACCLSHDPQHRRAVALVSSEIGGEISGEGGARC